MITLAVQRIEAFGKKLFESCQTLQIKKLLEYSSENANIWQCEIWHKEITQIKNSQVSFCSSPQELKWHCWQTSWDMAEKLWGLIFLSFETFILFTEEESLYPFPKWSWICVEWHRKAFLKVYLLFSVCGSISQIAPSKR